MNNFRGLLLIEYWLHLNKAQTSLALCSVCISRGKRFNHEIGWNCKSIGHYRVD